MKPGGYQKGKYVFSVRNVGHMGEDPGAICRDPHWQEGRASERGSGLTVLSEPHSL